MSLLLFIMCIFVSLYLGFFASTQSVGTKGQGGQE